MQARASIALSDASGGEARTTPSIATEIKPSKSEARVQDLIPIAMVIVGGCEPCAEQMVTRALGQGSSMQDIEKTLRIIADMQKRECFAKSVGMAVVARMEKPLAAGWRTLRQAMTSMRK